MKGLTIVLPLLLGLTLAGACSKAETPEALMKTGMEALGKRDPAAAAVAFRKVLDKNPNHYGATYQLAVALDRSGKQAEARPLWEKSLQMAETSKDQPTADTARKRLGRPAPAPEDPAMKEGLDALYAKRDYEAAVAAFRKVLDANPNHYGATYQLAAALDRAGKRAEARPLWEKALKMAEGYNDRPTADMARTRLAVNP